VNRCEIKTEFNNFARRSERSTSIVSPRKIHNRADLFRLLSTAKLVIPSGRQSVDYFNDYPTKEKGCGSRCRNVQAETGKARGAFLAALRKERVRATSPEYEPACYRNTGAFNGTAASRSLA